MGLPKDDQMQVALHPAQLLPSPHLLSKLVLPATTLWPHTTAARHNRCLGQTTKQGILGTSSGAQISPHLAQIGDSVKPAERAAMQASADCHHAQQPVDNRQSCKRYCQIHVAATATATTWLTLVQKPPALLIPRQLPT